MKKLRLALLVFFAGTACVFGYSQVTQALNADNSAPEITADTNNLEVSVSATDKDLLKGMEATDNRDGNVTDSLVVVSRSKFLDPGVINVNYAAFDSHNNVGTYVRKVTYTDYTSPTFSIKVPLVFRNTEEDPNYMTGITATDVLDGDITSMIRSDEGEVVTDEDGNSITPLKLQVTNTEGDTVSVDVEARLLDNKAYLQDAPALSDYLIYTKKGEKPEYRSLLTGVVSGQDVTAFEDSDFTASDVTIDDSEVDYDTPGVYSVFYTLNQTSSDLGTQSSTESLGMTEQFVVVKDS